MTHHEYLVSAYIANRHREALGRHTGRTPDGSRQVIRRAMVARRSWALT